MPVSVLMFFNTKSLAYRTNQ